MASSVVNPARRQIAGTVLLAIVVSVAAALMVTPIGPEGESIREGDLAPRALVATHQAQYESEVLTTVVRDAAAAHVLDVYFSPDPLVGQQQQEKLRQFFDDLRALYLRPGLTLAQRVNEAATIPGSSALSERSRKSSKPARSRFRMLNWADGLRALDPGMVAASFTRWASVSPGRR